VAWVRAMAKYGDIQIHLVKNKKLCLNKEEKIPQSELNIINSSRDVLFKRLSINLLFSGYENGAKQISCIFTSCIFEDSKSVEQLKDIFALISRCTNG